MMLGQEGRACMVELFAKWDPKVTDSLKLAYERRAAQLKEEQKLAAAKAAQVAESKLELLVRQEKQASQNLRKCRQSMERLIGEYDEAVGAHKSEQVIAACLSVLQHMEAELAEATGNMAAARVNLEDARLELREQRRRADPEAEEADDAALPGVRRRALPGARSRRRSDPRPHSIVLRWHRRSGFCPAGRHSQ